MPPMTTRSARCDDLPGTRQLFRLSPYAALAVNRKLVDALGLAALSWAALIALAATVLR